MQQLICLLFLILFPLQWMKAQSPNPLSERVYQEWSEESSSWENIRKLSNRFDQEGRLTETGNYEWFEHSWRPLDIQVNGYDEQGRQNYYRAENWRTTSGTYAKQFIYEVDFEYGENDQPVRVSTLQTELPSGLTRQTTLEYTYDDRNNRIKTSGIQIDFDGSEAFYLEENVFDKYGDLTSQYVLNWLGYESLSSFTYNLNGCRISETHKDRYGGSVWNLIDSTYNAYEEDCRIIRKELYTAQTQSFVLQSVVRYEYGFDEEGRQNFTKEEIMEKEDEEWSLIYQFETEYNAFDYPILQYYIYPGLVYRVTTAYDNEQRVILELVDIATSKDGDYTPERIYEVVFAEDGQVGSYYSAHEWNESTGRFEIEEYTIYTITKELTRLVTDRRFYQDFQSSVTEYLSDCDGRNSQTIFEITNTSIPDNRGKKTRDLYRYVNRSECAMAAFPDEPLVLFPNPARDYVDIVLPDQEVIGKITIADTSGRIIETYLHNLYGNHARIDVSGLDAGMYILYVGSGKATAAKRFEIYN